MTMKIHILPILKDNYAYILEGENGDLAVIDPGEAAPVIRWCENHGKRLTHIINTHHHGDHIAGNAELLSRYGASLAAPKADTHRIKRVDKPLEEGVEFTCCGEEAEIIATPGHTSGHIALYFPTSKALFCGDTLFSLGCGRLFEGTPQQMWDSFKKITALPDDTQIYPGHEYTLANGTFCLDVDPHNHNLIKRMEEAKKMREHNLPTIPVSLGTEKLTNAFLRAENVEHFAALREQKNNF